MQRFIKIGFNVFVIFTLVGGSMISVPNKVYAATSPTLSALTDYSVLGGAAVTCVGATTTTGGVGVSPLASITGFPVPCTAGGIGTQINTASAIAAQAENLATYTTLDQTCDLSFVGVTDLTVTDFSANGGGIGSVPPGVYCATTAFTLSGNLTLTGSGVHIFKTGTTLITSPGSSITGGDACNVWWRIGTAVTLDTTTSFIGNIFGGPGAVVNAMNAGATLNGRILSQAAGTITLNGNTISGPTCLPPPTPPSPPSSSGSSSGSRPRSISTPPVVVPTPTPTPTSVPIVVTPLLPKTGLGPEDMNIPWNIIISVGILASLSLLRSARRKQTI